MSRCAVCAHPDLEKINALRRGGAGATVILRQMATLGLSVNQIEKHFHRGHGGDDARHVGYAVGAKTTAPPPTVERSSVTSSEAEAAPVSQSEYEFRRVINNLNRQLVDAKAKKAELVDAIYRAALDGISGLTIPPVPTPRLDVRVGEEEVAVPLLSDLQLAKVTPDYNSEVCEQRIELYADKIERLTKIQRTEHPVKRCHVAAIGDIVEGELIFPGQSFLIDSSLYRQVTIDGPRIVGNFLRRMLGIFEFVDVTWVIGNHGALGGRARRDYNPETNADRMLGRILEAIFAAAGERRIKFHIPDGTGERKWYGIVEVGKYRALAIHGDQIRGAMGFPWYGLGKKVNAWASGVLPEDFQDVFMGHYHQLGLIPLNSRNVYANGSTESYNTYAQECLAAMSSPSQWLLFVHPKHGRVTAHYPISLTRPEEKR